MKRRGLTMTLLVVFLSSLISSTSHAQALVDAPVIRSMTVQMESPKIAEQGDAVVTIADLGAYLARIPERDRAAFLRSRTRIGDAIDNLMLPRLLAEEARQEGFVSRSELQAKLFQAATVLIAEEYMDDYFQRQELDNYNAMARELFLTEPARYRAPATVSFTHVLISPNEDRGELGVMREIFRIYEALSEGADLGELAEQFSDDPAVAENRGRYEDVDPATLDEDVALALSLMQPGQRSEPVRSQFGWHIIRLDGRTEGGALDWEEAEQQALQDARIRHMERARQRLVERLRSNDITVFPESIQKVLDQYDLDWSVIPETASREQ